MFISRIKIQQKNQFGYLRYINNAIRLAFANDVFTFTDIENPNEKKELIYQSETFNVLCHFTNYKGDGELETLLKEIVSRDTIYSDCLDSWRTCIEGKGKTISNKDFDKFWMANYLRFDTCTPEEQRQAGRKCSFAGFEYVMKNKSDIFNLDSELLDEIKAYLELLRPAPTD